MFLARQDSGKCCVRFGSKANKPPKAKIRLCPLLSESGQRQVRLGCPLCAKSRHDAFTSNLLNKNGPDIPGDCRGHFTRCLREMEKRAPATQHATALGFVDLGQRRVARCGLTIVRGKGNRGGGGLAERHVVAAPTRPFVVSRVAEGVAYDQAVK